MRNNKKQPMIRTVFSNVHEGTFKQLKNWYGTISTDKGSYIVTYECKLRSEAVALFQEEARIAGGQLDKYVGCF